MNPYQNLKYINLDRWASYWYQIKEVMALNPQTVLEIGVGNKVVYNFLSSSGVSVTSLDIDPLTTPDVVGSVEALPFMENSFDLILCAEVLEHLPFEKLEANLKEIRRVSKTYAIVTVPHWGRHFSADFRLPFFKRIKLQFKWPFLPIRHINHGQHFWEIGKQGFPLKSVKQAINKAGWSLLGDYVMFEMPYHHVFLLKK